MATLYLLSQVSFFGVLDAPQIFYQVPGNLLNASATKLLQL